MPVADPSNLIDPELRAALALLPPLHTLSAETLADLREATRAPPRPDEKEPTLPAVPVDIPATGGKASAKGLLYRPSLPGTRAAVLWLHGGGYVAGSARRDDPAARALALGLDCVVLSLDYRLAPETPFPAALDDAAAALRWLHDHADALSVDPARIFVRGNSAGGGLAAGLALRTRDEGGPPIALLALVYPMLDDRTGPHPVCGREVWTAEANRFGWASYLGPTPPTGAMLGYAAPARAERLDGLPPVWIGCGALDLFAGETLAFANRLVDAGVPVEFHLYPGAYHGFNLIASAEVAQRFERDLTAALARAMRPRNPAGE